MNDLAGTIAIVDPLAEYRRDREHIREVLDRVCERGEYVLGQEVEAFEVEFACYVGARFAVGVGNGTDAVALALRAVGVAPGDEVITASHTALPTAAAITMIGAVPVLVDIDRRTCTLDAGAAEAALTDRTRAIVAVHLYGCPAAIDALQDISSRSGIPLVEDCAQAHGARLRGQHVGTFGLAGAFSFYPTKNLPALGDGGMVVSQSPEIAERVRQLRQYGWDRDRVSRDQGWNSRLDAIQAAILRLRLGALNETARRRRGIAARYLREEPISAAAAQVAPADGEHAYHLFVIRSDRRADLRARLDAAGIGTGVHYERAVHQHPAYARYQRRHIPLDQTEAAVEQVVSIPVHPTLTDEQVERVAGTLAACLL